MKQRFCLVGWVSGASPIDPAQVVMGDAPLTHPTSWIAGCQVVGPHQSSRMANAILKVSKPSIEDAVFNRRDRIRIIADGTGAVDHGSQ